MFPVIYIISNQYLRQTNKLDKFEHRNTEPSLFPAKKDTLK